MKEEKRTRKLLGVSVIAVLLVAAAVVALMPALGFAQNRQTGDVEVSSNQVTDDPLGRVRIPFSDEAPLGSNLEQSMQRAEGTLVLSADEAAVVEAEIAATGAYKSPLVISAADFGADGANPDTQFFPFSGGYFQGNPSNYGCMVAPAYLPSGATVTDMFASCYDDDPTYNLHVDLRRVDNFSGDVVTMASVNTTGEYAGLQVPSNATIVEPLVIYPDYAYYVTTCVQSPDIRIYSVRLYYSE
jgi:hypothetical protein